jgi:serine protease Do
MRTLVIGGLAAAVCIAVGTASQAHLSAQDRERTPRQWLSLFDPAGSALGVSVRDLTADEIAKAKLDRPGGAFVDDVREGSAAARAGLRDGDIVVEFDGERVRSASHFTRLVRETAPGRSVSSSVIRDGSRVAVNVTPDASDRRAMMLPPELPRDFLFNLPRNLDPTPPLRGFGRGQIGVALSPLSDQLASYFGVKDGVLVSSVVSGSAAAQGGLRAGDVITAVNGQAVENVGDVTSVVRETRPGAALTLRVIRDRKELTLTVTMPERITEPRSALPV